MDGASPPGPPPTPGRAPSRGRRPVVDSAVLGTLIFVVTELMLFAGLISAFTISKANQLPGMWPPPGQPRLPAASTAFNTAALVVSGVLLVVGVWQWRRRSELARWTMLGAWVLGALFVALQGREWQALLADGLTVTSSTLGSFFYVIVGAHALHAVGALLVMAVAMGKVFRGTPSPGLLMGTQIFWLFVVGMWPVIYARVYF